MVQPALQVEPRRSRGVFVARGSGAPRPQVSKSGWRTIGVYNGSTARCTPIYYACFTYVHGPKSVAIKLKCSGCQAVACDPICKFLTWQTQILNGGRSCWLWNQLGVRRQHRHRVHFCRIQCQSSSLCCLFSLCVLSHQHRCRVKFCRIQRHSSSLWFLCSLCVLCRQHRRRIKFCRIQRHSSSLWFLCSLCVLCRQHRCRLQFCRIQCQSSSLCCQCSLCVLCLRHRHLVRIFGIHFCSLLAGRRQFYCRSQHKA